ncbi:hypothetical protein FTX61_03430 [Nitriliruptoraceae bacterium ZYF776]|nr:hypothetical protein [Profundirhabdus halotolerans]
MTGCGPAPAGSADQRDDRPCRPAPPAASVAPAPEAGVTHVGEVTVTARWAVLLAVLAAAVVVLLARSPQPPPDQDPRAPRAASATPDRHDALLEELVGYGWRTRGGADGRVVWVTTTADDGPGSLRAAAEAPGPTWVRFDPAVFPPEGGGGRIHLERPIDLGARVTVDGRGARVVVENHGFFVDEHDVIVTNLVFDFAAAHAWFQGNAAVTIGWPSYGVQDVWIHGNTFLGAGPGELDGGVDVLRSAHRVTVSWNRFVRWDKTMLLGTDELDPREAPDEVSIHHNWFERNGQRQPLARFGRVHVWNNWFDHWDFDGSYGEAVVAGSDAQVLSERNLFEHDRRYPAITSVDEGGGPGDARDVESAFVGPVRAEVHRPDRVTFDPGEDHDYDAAPVATRPEQRSLRETLRAGAGWQP